MQWRLGDLRLQATSGDVALPVVAPKKITVVSIQDVQLPGHAPRPRLQLRNSAQLL